MDKITEVLKDGGVGFYWGDRYSICTGFIDSLLCCRPTRIKLSVSDTYLPGHFKFKATAVPCFGEVVLRIDIGNKTHYLTRTLREWFIARVKMGTTKTFYAKIWKLKS